MAGRFQPPPIQGQTFLDEGQQAPSYAWKKWFELIPPAVTSPASSAAPPAASNSAGIEGQIAFDQNFAYFCIQSSSPTQQAIWKRLPLSSF